MRCTLVPEDDHAFVKTVVGTPPGGRTKESRTELILLGLEALDLLLKERDFAAERPAAEARTPAVVGPSDVSGDEQEGLDHPARLARIGAPPFAQVVSDGYANIERT